MKEKTMKRAINCVAMLMLAFAVTFGFQVNAANAATCQVSVATPCRATIDTAEFLDLSFDSGTDLDVIFQNTSFTNTAQIVPTIGSEVQQPVNLQPGSLSEKKYPTGRFSTATFENQSVLQGTVVDITVTVGSAKQEGMSRQKAQYCNDCCNDCCGYNNTSDSF